MVERWERRFRNPRMPTRDEISIPNGDPPAERWFAEEVHAHDASLKAYLRAAYPGMRDVDDVVQESYLRIWKARLAQRIHFTKSYLFQIARNLSLDLVRRNRASPIDDVPEPVALAVCDPARGLAPDPRPEEYHGEVRRSDRAATSFA